MVDREVTRLHAFVGCISWVRMITVLRRCGVGGREEREANGGECAMTVVGQV